MDLSGYVTQIFFLWVNPWLCSMSHPPPRPPMCRIYSSAILTVLAALFVVCCTANLRMPLVFHADTNTVLMYQNLLVGFDSCLCVWLYALGSDIHLRKSAHLYHIGVIWPGNQGSLFLVFLWWCWKNGLIDIGLNFMTISPDGMGHAGVYIKSLMIIIEY